jgi:hypothetical protein
VERWPGECSQRVTVRGNRLSDTGDTGDMDCNGGASAPLVRLRGVGGWDTSAILADGRRWVAVTLRWLDESEPTAVVLSPEDAEVFGRALARTAHEAGMRDLGDMN